MGHYSRSASDSPHRRSYSRRRHRHHHRHRSNSRRRYRSSRCRHSYSRHHRDYSPSRYRHRDDSRRRYRRSSSSRYRRHRRDRDYSRSHHRYRSNHRNHYHKRRYSSGRRSSDEIVHFKWEKGQKVGDYSIISKISDGTFGRVLYCEKDGINYALKVIRDVERYTNSAKIEIDILLDIKETDEENQSHCVVLHDHFLHKDKNMCLVFEFLGLSLYEFLDKNDFKGFFIADIQTIAFQTLKGLSFLKQKKIIHTDIKPENILLTCKADEFIEVPFPRSKTGMMTKRPATSDVKLVDFGSAIYDEDYHSSIINTRQYRSPEVILDIGWSYSSDIWSLGCTLVEIYTGHLLFKTKTHLEHLAMIERVLGPIPGHMINAARKTDGKQYLHPTDSRIDWPDGCKSKTSISTVEESKSIFELIKPEHRIFAEFIRYILNPDSSARPTPEEAMEHEFFMLKLPEN